MDHRDVMENLAITSGWDNGVEVGLGSGMLFNRFLASGLNMIGVDIGSHHKRKKLVNVIASCYPENAIVYWMASLSAAPLIPDGSADFVFIDAAHGYGSVSEDIRAWERKVRPGGWFGGHDFHEAFPGVKRAVIERFGKHGFDLLDGWIWVRK